MTTNNSLDLAATIAWVAELAREVGAFQRQSIGQPTIEFKGIRELVTAVDRQSEEMIVEALLKRFPSHDIFGEESHRKDEGQSPYRWIIDPLDGTTNYAHSLPIYCVSIGLERRHDDGHSDIVGSVIYAPALDQCFTAWRGGGSFMNGEPIHVSKTEALIDSVLATGFAYVRDKTANDNLANWCHLLKNTRDLRRFGSAALDLAYVAMGRFDGFWEYHLQPYDVAAGALLVQEAGGQVTDTEGGDQWLFGRRIIASNGPLHALIQAELKPVVEDGFIPLN